MANLVSRTSGNLTTNTTWNTVETGTRAIQNVFSATTNTTTSVVYNANAEDITVANLSVIEGLLLFCNRVNTTGTVTVSFSQDSGTSNTRQVTVNASDLPASPSWVFFEFGSTLTGDGGTDYAVGIHGSSAGNATFYRNGTAANWTHLIVTNQNPGSVAAGDVFYVVGELISAGTGNDFTVTMDSTATTDYGTGTDGTSVNGMEVGKRGTLTWGATAATNYYLKMSGSINVWCDGTWNRGTVATPTPRDSTTVMEFDPVADGGMGFYARSGSTVTEQGLSRTSGKNIVSCKLNTDEAAAQTTLGVDTDTGWLNGDEIVIASTTRTASQTEKRVLNANANASDMTVSVGLTNAHSGTSPTQAEVILLTRNNKFRSATSTIMTYFNIEATAVVDIDWGEYRYLGENATDKRGIEIETTTGSFNMQYSSLYDTEDGGVHITGATANNITFSNNVCYNLNTVAGTAAPGAGFMIPAATSGTSITISNNLLLLMNCSTTGTAGNAGVYLADVGITFTGNTVVSTTGGSASGGGIEINESNPFGDFSNNTVHSGLTNGIRLFGLNIPTGTLSGFNIWRNSSFGVQIANTGGSSTSHNIVSNLTFESLLAFGNTTDNIAVNNSLSQFVSDITLSSCRLSGDSTFATTNGYRAIGSVGGCYFTALRLFNCYLGEATGIYVAHTNDLSISGFKQITSNNTLFASATEGSTSGSNYSSFFKSERHDRTNGNHLSRFPYGTITIETTTTHTGGQSVKMTPNSASFKLESGSFKVAVANAATLTPTVYVYEDGSYNGARARLILKRNDAIGITADTVIDTATAASDAAWEALTGTTASATDDGVMEFVVDCDGTAGNLFVDSFTVA